MESCDPSRRVHRTCLRTWPERERYLRERLTAWATRAPAPRDPTASHLLYRTEAIAAVISVLVDDDVLRGREWVENVLVEVAHVDALDQRSFPLDRWSDWMRRDPQAWRAATHPSERDDIDALVIAQAALRERWPDTAAVLQSPEFEAFAIKVRRRAVELPEEEAAERRKWAEYNARVLVWSRTATPACSRCASPGPHPLSDEREDGPRVLTCRACEYPIFLPE